MWKLSHPSLYRSPAQGKLVTGSVVEASATQEMYKNFEQVKRKTLVHAATMPQPLVLDLDLLPAASEAYCISPDPKDYVLVQLPIVTVGVPNRNLQAFPLEEVAYFDPQQGQLVYQTFNFKGTYVDHCFPAGTKVRVYNKEANSYTSKNIEEVQVGELVLTDKLQHQPVVRLYQNGEKALTKIVTYGTLQEVYVTDNHPVLVVDRRQVFGRIKPNGKANKALRHRDFRDIELKTHWRPVSDVYAGDYLCIPIKFGGTKTVDPSLAFVAGAYLAEGSVSHKNERYPEGSGLRFSCGAQERPFIEAIKHHLVNLGLKPIEREVNQWNVTDICVNSVDFTHRILALCGEYSGQKRLMGDLREWDAESVRVFLGAYMSGDGGWDKKKGTYRIRSSSMELLRDLQQAFAFIGVPACIGVDEMVVDVLRRNAATLAENPNARVITPRHDSGYLRLTSHFAPLMKPYLVGKEDWSKVAAHDNSQLIIMGDYLLTPIRKVQREIGKAEVYNLEVEGDHTYIANDVVVHNCNSDPRQAKGIIVDSSMQYVPKYDVWKINIVTLWDRTKDKKIVDDILNKKRTGYSMGSYVMNFVCSICGKLNDSCQHMKNKGEVYGPDARLSYQLCTGVTYFETSVVDSPADSSAHSEDIYL